MSVIQDRNKIAQVFADSLQVFDEQTMEAFDEGAVVEVTTRAMKLREAELRVNASGKNEQERKDSLEFILARDDEYEELREQLQSAKLRRLRAEVKAETGKLTAKFCIAAVEAAGK